jgi:hypothetical protein
MYRNSSNLGVGACKLTNVDEAGRTCIFVTRVTERAAQHGSLW